MSCDCPCHAVIQPGLVPCPQCSGRGSSRASDTGCLPQAGTVSVMPTSGLPGKHEDLTSERNLKSMALCRNCGWQDARPTVELCWPCYKHQRRTGRSRPAELVLRHLARTIEKALTAGQ